MKMERGITLSVWTKVMKQIFNHIWIIIVIVKNV